MKKTNKVLSLILAVSMLLSMLACFTLPVTAAGEQTVYYVGGITQWYNIVSAINDSADGFAGKTIYLQSDIDFNNNWKSHIDKFAGTLDGNGHKFINIGATTKGTGTSSNPVFHPAGLVETLTGTIQNLTIDSTCTFADIEIKEAHASKHEAHLGAFAAYSEGGTIKNCAFYGTYDATPNTYSTDPCVGGFIGRAKSGVTTIEGCIFGGTITGNTSKGKGAAAFVGTKNSGSSVKVNLGYSVASGSVTGNTTGMVCANTTIKNSYAMGGMTAYVGSSDANYQMDDLNKAVWTINKNATSDCKILSVDTSNLPCFGSANDRVVKLTTVNGSSTTEAYYAPRTNASRNTQTIITPETVSGKTPIVSGAEYIDGNIYVGDRDITVEYTDTAAYELAQAQAKLAAMVEAYEGMESKYFTDMAAMNNWAASAKADLNSTTLSVLQGHIDAEANLTFSLASMSAPDGYPSISEYNTYKYVETIKNYKVSTKEDWLAAVAMSNYVENPDATDFKGITLHLANDIDMEQTPMLPLCYGWAYDGNLNGRNFAFENINIVADNAYGPVGLISTISASGARTIQNLGIASGRITVTGLPRYKTTKWQIKSSGNIVGSIAGRGKGTIRKCWNNADLYVENIDQVGGIIGDPRDAATVDSCFNLGRAQAGTYSIMGDAGTGAKIFNSLGAAANDGLTIAAARSTKAELETNFLNIYGVIKTMGFNSYSSTSSTKKTQQAVVKTLNNSNTVLSYAEAAWNINKNYQAQQLGDKKRVYFALNENGEVRFGKSANGYDQIHRIKLVCAEHGENCTTHPVSYAYGSEGYWFSLDAGFEANYYASPDTAVSINKNNLKFARTVAATDLTFTVYVGYNADRGNVNGSSDGKINVLDALAAVQMAAGKKAENLLTADLNGNYAIDINDAYQIVRYVFGGKEKATFTPGKSENRKDDYLKIVSYNIKSFHYDPSAGNSNNNGTAMYRVNEVMKEVDALDPEGDKLDIICFQELDRYNKDTWTDADGDGEMELSETVDQLQMLAERLNIPYDAEHSLFTITIPSTVLREDGGYGHGILTRHKILESHTEMFEGKHVPGDVTKTYDSSEARGFTWVKLDLDKDNVYTPGKDLIFVGVHFSTPLELQLQYMTEYMRENFPESEGHRIVSAGDYNLAAFRMKDVLDRSSYTAINGGAYINAFTRTSAHSGSMVDNIIVSNNVEYYKPSFADDGVYNRYVYYNSSGNIEEGATELDKTNGIWSASDHVPIWAYIKK